MRQFIQYKNIIILSVFVLLLSSLQEVSTQPRRERDETTPPIQWTIYEISFVFKTTETLDKNYLVNILSLQEDKILNRETFEEDRQRVKKYYFDNGFFDVIVDTAAEYNTEEETVNLNFIIIENTRYTIDRIFLLGLDKVTPEVSTEIKQILTLKPGDHYDRTAILTETRMVLSILQDNGYFFANLDTVNGTIISKYPPASSAYRNKVNIQLSFIGADKQYRFGNTSINISDGKYRFDSYLISRELVYEKGQLYNKSQLTQSERNFTNISLVQSGRITVDTIIENTGIINMKANIFLTKKYELTPNLIAVDIDNQLFGGAGIQYSDRNFFNGGRTFQIGLQGLVHSKDVNRIDATSTIYQPFLFNYRITATYNLKFIFYNFDKSLQFTTLQNLLRFNYFIAPYTFYNSAHSDITFDLLRTKYKQDVIIDPDTLKAGTISNEMNSIIGFTIVHNSTNDVFSPTKGSYHSITLENAGLLPRFISIINSNVTYAQYFKVFVPNKFYFDIAGGRATSIFASQINIGDIIEYGQGPHLVPVAPLYKFFSGGSSSLRGWNAKENGILDFPEAGGTFLFEGSMEFRWKTFSKSMSFFRNFWTVYFLDFGNVWEKDKEFQIKEIALAVGFGLRYDTFIGPLRIDLGFKLYDPNAEESKKWLFDDLSKTFKDNKFAVQFGLGNAF